VKGRESIPSWKKEGKLTGFGANAMRRLIPIPMMMGPTGCHLIFLPPDQDPTGTIEPGMGALHHESAALDVRG